MMPKIEFIGPIALPGEDGKSVVWASVLFDQTYGYQQQLILTRTEADRYVADPNYRRAAQEILANDWGRGFSQHLFKEYAEKAGETA